MAAVRRCRPSRFTSTPAGTSTPRNMLTCTAHAQRGGRASICYDWLFLDCARQFERHSPPAPGAALTHRQHAPVVGGRAEPRTQQLLEHLGPRGGAGRNLQAVNKARLQHGRKPDVWVGWGRAVPVPRVQCDYPRSSLRPRSCDVEKHGGYRVFKLRVSLRFPSVLLSLSAGPRFVLLPSTLEKTASAAPTLMTDTAVPNHMVHDTEATPPQPPQSKISKNNK